MVNKDNNSTFAQYYATLVPQIPSTDIIEIVVLFACSLAYRLLKKRSSYAFIVCGLVQSSLAKFLNWNAMWRTLLSSFLKLWVVYLQFEVLYIGNVHILLLNNNDWFYKIRCPVWLSLQDHPSSACELTEELVCHILEIRSTHQDTEELFKIVKTVRAYLWNYSTASGSNADVVMTLRLRLTSVNVLLAATKSKNAIEAVCYRIWRKMHVSHLKN